MINQKDKNAFFELVRAGLWEKEARLSQYGQIDDRIIYQLSEEQALVGLVTAGLEHVVDTIIPKETLLHFIYSSLQIEQNNRAMNSFIGVLINKMRDADIYSLLMKGQGVAQCYERPLWRSNGDIDFLLSDENYSRAKTFLIQIATKIEREYKYVKHIGFEIESWYVELHGNLRSGLSRRMDKELDVIKYDIFCGGNVRSWQNDNTPISLPKADEDAVYIFTHFLCHFYKGGIGLRQICDWCRLLWTYKDSLNQRLLETRIRKMGLMTEWKAFGAFAVDYLGMSESAMPFYSSDRKWKRKANKICTFILEVGNFGHNRNNVYYDGYPYLIRKFVSFSRRTGDLLRHVRIFPMDSLRFFSSIVINGLQSALRGE